MMESGLFLYESGGERERIGARERGKIKIAVTKGV
jgi:hypothetical protein